MNEVEMAKAPRSSQFWIVLLGCFLWMSWGCNQAPTQVSQGGKPQDDSSKGLKPVPVAVTHVTLGEAVNRYTTTAALEAENHAEILSRTTGVIREILVEEGDLVEKDQLLLRLENDDQLLRLKQAEIKLSQLRQEYDRREKMKSMGILANQEYEDIQNQLETARAEKEVAELTLSYTEVRAPFSGNVVRRLVDHGANVQPGRSLFEIMDTSPLLVRAHIPANRLGQIKVGQSVTTYLDSSGETLQGKISLVSPIVDPESGTVKVTAEIHSYPEGTRPGDFAEVRFVTARREGALMVPSISVFEEQGQNILFTVVDGKSVKRDVTVGFTDGGLTEILKGIGLDDLVVSKGQRNLRDGIPVEILEGPTSKQEGSGEKTLARAGL